MKPKPLYILLSAMFIYVLIFQNSCGWGNQNYTLTVIIGDGISGTPETGTYEYEEFSEVEYSYEMDEGAIQPEIYLNTLRNVVLSGTLTIYCDTVMTVKQIDIRTKWVMVFSESGEDTIEWTIEFSGNDLRSGTFIDDRGYSGTWEVSDSNDLTITYSDWENYVFTGTLSGLSGDWEGEGNTGTWYIYLKK